MAPRCPSIEDFPASLTVRIESPSAAAQSRVRISNVLILLHGLGGNHEAFANFGGSMNLPETVCIAIRGLALLPFDLGGWHWGDDIMFDERTGLLDPQSNLDKAESLIQHEIIKKILVEKCSFTTRQILIFGHGQGGSLALAIAQSLHRHPNHESSKVDSLSPESKMKNPPIELGGIISIGGPIPNSSGVNNDHDHEKPSPTPVLLLGGDRASSMNKSAVGQIRQKFEFVDYHKWQRSGDDMPRNKTEILPLMRFLARRLQSWHGVPEGAIPLA